MQALLRCSAIGSVRAGARSTRRVTTDAWEQRRECVRLADALVFEA